MELSWHYFNYAEKVHYVTKHLITHTSAIPFLNIWILVLEQYFQEISKLDS